MILGTDVTEGDEAFWQKFRTEEWPYFENQFSEYKETISHIQKEILECSHKLIRRMESDSWK